MKHKTKNKKSKYEIPNCLNCGKDILRKGDLLCIKCEIKEYRDYLRDIDGSMNEPSNNSE